MSGVERLRDRVKNCHQCALVSGDVELVRGHLNLDWTKKDRAELL
jgi:hypothetical protein